MVDFWGVVLGGAVTLIGSIGVKWWDEWRQRRALRAAFGAEIEALINIVEIRKHEARAQEWLAKWRKGEDYVPKMYGFDGAKMYEDPVYRSNLDKIGMLGAEAADAVQFYTNMIACRVNLRVFVTGEVKDFSIGKRIEWVESLLAVWQPTKALGLSLVKRLSSRWA
jgi:hypothetical protein